ncbi:PiggyBac transposable element-derived protein 4 [Anabarilius grahami]|uniref:PiggyBac transposable element-derived protein 4 n=1 Tax=Anabarilius grahami TaxID=495550 RepID=A0A3N0XR90_ANAGA|nr:PiggyBac transposable element-derived protein 4 [Anabarilius grahami]
MPARRHRKQNYTETEVLKLLFAADEDECSVCSSATNSVSSEDEADFLEGIDRSLDTVEDVGEPFEPSQPPCTSQPSVPVCRGRGYVRRANTRGYRSRSQRSRGMGSRLETVPNHSGGWKTEKDPDHLPRSPPNCSCPKESQLPKLRDYWRVKSIFHVPYPQKVMSRDRFLSITWNMHMSDPAEDAANDRKKGTDEYDCLHRIRPLYDSLRVACKAVYHPERNLSVDESMVATKARISLKQYIKNKPTKWGIKLFVLCDNNGYTVDFNIYTGKSSFASGKVLSFHAVMSLVRKDFLDLDITFTVIIFYTSPVLFQHLYNLGFGACGTIRDTRIGVPNTKVNALTKKSPRGSIRWIRQGSLLCTKWMDTREVSVCTTLHTAYSGDTVKRVCKSSSGYTTLDVPVPTAVKDYNRFMGGVDLSDQLIGSYSSWKKSREWYMTVLHHFIDIAVTNSYLVHKQLCCSQGEQPMTH